MFPTLFPFYNIIVLRHEPKCSSQFFYEQLLIHEDWSRSIYYRVVNSSQCNLECEADVCFFQIS